MQNATPGLKNSIVKKIPVILISDLILASDTSKYGQILTVDDSMDTPMWSDDCICHNGDASSCIFL